MYINTDIILHQLTDSYEILMHQSSQKTSLCSFRIYDGTPLLEHILYIIRIDQLAFLDSLDENAAFLCIGAEKAMDLHVSQDLILIRDYVDLASLFNKISSIFDQFNRWEETLDHCSPNLTGIQKMLNESRDILRGTIVLADYHFNYLAYTPDFANSVNIIRRSSRGQTPSYIIDELLTDPQYFSVQNSREIFFYNIHDGVGLVPAMCYNLFRGEETDYRARILFVSYDHLYAEDQKYLVMFLAGKINSIYNNISEYSLPIPAFDGLREAIINCIRKQASSGSMISSMLRYVRWNISDQYLLCKFQSSFLDNTKEINAVSGNELELLFSDSCAVLYEDSIVLVINLTLNESKDRKVETILHNDLAAFIRERLYKIGISNSFTGFQNIFYAYKEAAAAYRLGNFKDNMFWYYHFSDYALDYMMNKCTEELPAIELCNRGLLRLMEFDNENGTSYVSTLKTFADAKYNVTHAAELLYIHRTTLLKHLKKIVDLTELDLGDWTTRVHLALSFQLLEK